MTELEVVEPKFGDSIVEYSKDRREVTFVLAGEEYLATKPKKVDEWFVELQMALSSGENGRLLLEIEKFFRKIVGAEAHEKIRARRLDDDDDLTWTEMSQVMYDIFEVWTTEPDQPVRPTGRPSASSRGRKPAARR